MSGKSKKLKIEWGPPGIPFICEEVLAQFGEPHQLWSVSAKPQNQPASLQDLCLWLSGVRGRMRVN